MLTIPSAVRAYQTESTQRYFNILWQLSSHRFDFLFTRLTYYVHIEHYRCVGRARGCEVLRDVDAEATLTNHTMTIAHCLLLILLMRVWGMGSV